MLADIAHGHTTLADWPPPRSSKAQGLPTTETPDKGHGSLAMGAGASRPAGWIPT